MKNMWKERFEKCSRVLVHKSGSKMHEVFSILSESLIGFAARPHRADAETWVEELGNGRYKVVQEAPNAGQWAQGYRNESIVHIYKRGGDTFLKLESAKRLRVFDNEKDDGFVISSVVRGYKVVKHSIEEHFLTWLAEKVELSHNIIMNDNERFLKLMRNVMLSDNYSVLVDGIASRVYEHTPTGTINIAIGEPVCEDLTVSVLHGFCWANDYVGAYDKNDNWHDFEFVKYVKLSELLG